MLTDTAGPGLPSAPRVSFTWTGNATAAVAAGVRVNESLLVQPTRLRTLDWLESLTVLLDPTVVAKLTIQP